MDSVPSLLFAPGDDARKLTNTLQSEADAVIADREDTLWKESEILATRESSSRPDVGIVLMRPRGVNQRGEVVIEFHRSFMGYKRGARAVEPGFPKVEAEWRT